MAVLDELLAYLQAQGIGTAEVDLFKARMPETPDGCGTLYETPGSAGDLGFGVAGIQHEWPGVQVVWRGEPYDEDTPRAKVSAAIERLARVQGATLSGAFYLTIRPLSGPFQLKTDENNRHYIAANVLCQKEPS